MGNSAATEDSLKVKKNQWNVTINCIQNCSENYEYQ